MSSSALAIVLHQLFFQGMFFAKNLLLGRKLGKPVRGKNIEATVSIVFFAIFIGLAIYLAWGDDAVGSLSLLPDWLAQAAGYLLMFVSIGIALASLLHLGDSWRVGVIDEQVTQLVKGGIYGFSRNPYFLAYLLTFAAYTVLLQNVLLLSLSLVGFSMIHLMVRAEEVYLSDVHGEEYRQYQRGVARYLGFKFVRRRKQNAP